MPTQHDDTSIDWSKTTWEGSRREQIRRWADLPLERMILAIEEMERLAEKLGTIESEPPAHK
jgi:hypothetical protein